VTQRHGAASTTYYYSGPLDSTEALTDGSGNLIMSSQFLPFGQEIPSGTDTNHYKFTGKERDAETSGGVPGAGNDYFGARYYASSMGRFMSPDWSKNPEGVPYADLSNPQTLDLYSYVDNNPLTHSDVDGHIQAPAQTNGLPAVDAGTDSSYNGTPVPGGDAYNSMAGQTAWAFLTGGNPAAASSAWAQQQTASVVFGETSSLTSEVDKNGKPITTPGADPNLDTARENVADVSKRNSGVYSHTPTAEELKNPQIKAAWEASQAAANESKGSLPGKYFFIRQEEVGKQRPSKRAGFGQGTPIKSYGPFKNAGGGDVPRGSRTYIDIYDK
jgi:RHS repeat-associated protein